VNAIVDVNSSYYFHVTWSYLLKMHIFGASYTHALPNPKRQEEPNGCYSPFASLDICLGA